MNIIERFMEKVDKNGIDKTGDPLYEHLDGRCWKWKDATNKNGYALFQIMGRRTNANRVSYELFVGPITDNKFVCHHCDNRECTNPDHLYLGTPQDNSNDMVSRKRHRNGINHKKSSNKTHYNQPNIHQVGFPYTVTRQQQMIIDLWEDGERHIPTIAKLAYRNRGGAQQQRTRRIIELYEIRKTVFDTKCPTQQQENVLKSAEKC
jgi:hypothetical protein